MRRELQKIWNAKVKIIPLVVGSLGAIPRKVGNRLKQIRITVGTVTNNKVSSPLLASLFSIFLLFLIAWLFVQYVYLC